jgi:fumarate hydratase class II
MTKYRVEKDSMGELNVPYSALYGAQTQRAIDNFPISSMPMPKAFITSLIQVKLAAAKANTALGLLSEEKLSAIDTACNSLLNAPDLMQHFPVDVFQTGSGTSSNMNANEVIANVANQANNLSLHPNDDINLGQSSNDVIPTTIQVSAVLATREKLLPAIEHIITVMEQRKTELKDYCKTGRTHLMDAMPIRMDQVISGWSSQLQMNVLAIMSILDQMQMLPLGGTAVGTAVNAHPEFSVQFNIALSEQTDINFQRADNFFALIGAQDNAVRLSGSLKAVAVSLMKIANDLRWMNSGPLAGLGEITLPALQPGSSIMPGKVNPVIPEAVAMVSAQVIGNDATITIGGQSGNFELNVMLPVIARNLLESIEILTNSIQLLADKAMAGFTMNAENLEKALDRNPVLVTALNPLIGYEKAAAIAKLAYQLNKPILEVAMAETDFSEEKLKQLLDPHKLTG